MTTTSDAYPPPLPSAAQTASSPKQSAAGITSARLANTGIRWLPYALIIAALALIAGFWFIHLGKRSH